MSLWTEKTPLRVTEKILSKRPQKKSPRNFPLFPSQALSVACIAWIGTNCGIESGHHMKRLPPEMETRFVIPSNISGKITKKEFLTNSSSRVFWLTAKVNQSEESKTMTP